MANKYLEVLRIVMKSIRPYFDGVYKKSANHTAMRFYMKNRYLCGTYFEIFLLRLRDNANMGARMGGGRPPHHFYFGWGVAPPNK
jgi:hypothetical protein